VSMLLYTAYQSTSICLCCQSIYTLVCVDQSTHLCCRSIYTLVCVDQSTHLCCQSIYTLVCVDQSTHLCCQSIYTLVCADQSTHLCCQSIYTLVCVDPHVTEPLILEHITIVQFNNKNSHFHTFIKIVRKVYGCDVTSQRRHRQKYDQV